MQKSGKSRGEFHCGIKYKYIRRLEMEALKPRLGKFGLEVAEDKTRILPIGRFKGTKDDFDFLGFTFFNTHTREGKYRLGVRTSKKKLKAKKQNLERLKQAGRSRNLPVTPAFVFL